MSPTSSATWLMPTRRAVMAGSTHVANFPRRERPFALLDWWVHGEPVEDRGLGGPGAQPQERLPRAAARRAGGHHRAVRIRQVLAGVRHDLRRGAAPLRRVAQRVC